MSRKRLLIIGVHKKTGKKYLNAFDEVFKVNELKTTRELLKPLTFSSEIDTNQIPFMAKPWQCMTIESYQRKESYSSKDT